MTLKETLTAIGVSLAILSVIFGGAILVAIGSANDNNYQQQSEFSFCENHDGHIVCQ